MKVVVFYPSKNNEHISVLRAFYNGLLNSSVNVSAQHINTYEPGCCDVAVIFGVYKKEVPISFPRGRVLAGQRSLGLNTIVLEKGYIRRDKYYAVGVNGLNGRADFNNDDCPRDRFEELDVEMGVETPDGEHIVLVSQVPHDASVQNIDIFSWCATKVNEIRRLTNREIRFRPHPLAVKYTPAILGTTYSVRDLSDDFKNAWAVVTYNSNVGVDAVLAGIPAFAFDKGSMIYDIASNDISDIVVPLPYINRVQWASNIAYAQWNLEEMENGLAWRHIEPVATMKKQGAVA